MMTMNGIPRRWMNPAGIFPPTTTRIWRGEAWLETVELDAVHYLPSGSVALYYLRPGQTEYSETQKVFARVSGENQYTFDLGGLTVTGLRIDPDSVGGVPTRLDGVVLNPVQPWYLRFVPNGGQWLLLLFVPAVGAAFACLAVDVFRKK